MPQIPAGWKETTLGKLLDVKHGFAFKWDYISDKDNGNVLLTPWNFAIWGGWKDWKKFYNWEIPISYILKWWEIVITMTDLSKDWDTLGFPAIVPIDDKRVFLHNQRIWLVEFISDNLDLKYCFYKLKTNEYQKYIVNTASWSTVRHTSPDKIKSFIFHLPPLPEQQAIAAVLSSFDDKIELLRAENQTLEQMGQELFKERFGKWKVGDELPEGWRVGKLSEIADFLNGLPLQKYPANEWEESLPVIKIREMKSWITDQTGRASVDIDQKYIVQDWDVLFSRSGSLELVFWEYWPWALNQHLFKVTSSNYSKRFYYYWILYHLSEFRVIANTKATTMGHIQRGHLDLAKVTIPDSESLIAFDKVMSKIIQKLLDNKGQIQTLSATRDQLLPKLMSGEVRVEF